MSTEGARRWPSRSSAACPTARGRAKAERRDALLSSAAQLFASRGFDGVSIEDLGSSVGVSGPAVYRHFPSKQAVLAALLVGVSEGLLAGGRAVVSAAADDASAARARSSGSTSTSPCATPTSSACRTATSPPSSPQDRESVRDLQRRYIDLWVDVLARLSPSTDRAELRLRAQATFGLLNSTPHSARAVSSTRTRALLEEMALAALGAPRPSPECRGPAPSRHPWLGPATARGRDQALSVVG